MTDRTAIWNEAMEEAWHLIDSAPKDGSFVLLCGGAIDNAHYAPDFAPECVVAKWDGKSWLYAVAEAGYVGCAYEEPTHWMRPPAAAIRARKIGEG